MVLEFDALTHTYFLDGRELPSVTQLLGKHGIAPNFIGVDPNVLQYKANRGVLVHGEMENFINFGAEGESDEFYYFKENIYPHFKNIQAEVKVYTSQYAGTVDFIGIDVETGERAIIDYKTGTVHLDSVRWQLSMYRKALGEEWKDAKLYVFDAKIGNSKWYEVSPIADTEIEKLLEAESNGVLYKAPVLVLDKKVEERALALEQQIAGLEATIKELSDERTKMRNTIKQAMEEQHIKKFETPNFNFTFVDSYTKDGIDTKLLKEKEPKLYEKYYKPSVVASSLKVTQKKVKAVEGV